MVQTVTGVKSNLWRTQESGLMAPVRRRFPINSLGLYVPLGHPELSGSPIISKDLNAHSCTADAPTHNPPINLDFDGVDDYINCGSASSIDNIFDGGGTIIAWINVDSDGENDNGVIWIKGIVSLATVSETASKVKLRFTHVFTGGAPSSNGVWETTDTELTIGTWYMVALTYNNGAVGNNPTIHINNVALTVGSGLTETSTPSLIRDSDAGSDLLIGGISGAYSYNGKIGEVWVYPGLNLTARNVDQAYNATKWRYI